MGQVSSKLRRGVDCYFHWCPACDEMHPLPDRWQFNGNLEKPTFIPSFRHTGYKKHIENGVWTDPWWDRDAAGNVIPSCCHYVLTDGVMNFCNDCTHGMSNEKIPMPNLPDGLKDL